MAATPTLPSMRPGHGLLGPTGEAGDRIQDRIGAFRLLQEVVFITIFARKHKIRPDTLGRQERSLQLGREEQIDGCG